MDENDIVIITIIEMLIAIIIITIIVFKAEMKKNKIKRNIKENCTPRRGIIKDILIESIGREPHKCLKFYPVIEDKITGKMYISFGNYDYTSYSTLVSSCFNNWEYEIDVSGNKLNIGDVVNIYINREIEILKMENGIIKINNIPRKYRGIREEMSQFSIMHMENYEIANEAIDTFMNDGTEIILYEGFIDTNLYAENN